LPRHSWTRKVSKMNGPADRRVSEVGNGEQHLRDEKQVVRQAALDARARLDSADRAAAAEAIKQRILELPAVRRASVVLGYSALGSELDVAPVLAMLSATARIAYPRVVDDAQIVLHSCGPEQLEPGFRGILEPPTCSQTVTPDQVSVVLVPGVAFDRERNRVGYGKGYYDRLLAQMPHAVKIGVSYDETLFERVPVEPHDAPLDAVVTPSAVY